MTGAVSRHRVWRMLSGDRSRQVVTCVAAAAQVLLPTLWAPRFAEDEQPPDVIGPAPYTFGVWLPIFAASAGYAGLQARPGSRESDVMRASGWPLAAAFASTGVWAPLVRTGKYWSAQTALAGIAAFSEVARRRLADRPASDTDPLLVTAGAAAAGMLAAWGISATGVNLAAMLVGKGVVRSERARSALGVGLLLGLGAVGAASTVATIDAAPRISKIYAGTVLWALTGVAVGQRKRSRSATIAATAAAIPVLVVATRGKGRSPVGQKRRRTSER